MKDLAPYAAHSDATRGRRYPEDPSRARSEYQRDKDRIVHSGAFRRLEYKTQVFVNHEGDLFRTRLTHSIEVAQIARSVARHLNLNEDLVEAIALAHDLGHTPFGHAGQDALNECMRESGGFEHNLQSLRVVDQLEERYGAFDGLNLTFETREGILKHCTQANAKLLGDVGERFLQGQSPSLEAQLANLADEIAYNNHDVDDGLRSGLITLDEILTIPLVKRHFTEATTLYPHASERRRINETVRRMINTLVLDLIAESQRRIAAAAPSSLADVRAQPGNTPLIAYTDTAFAESRKLKRFLRDKLYQHYIVQRMSAKGRRIVRDLFAAFTEDRRLLPPGYQPSDPALQPRAIADYISGMTDRYAMREHRRLFAIEVE